MPRLTDPDIFPEAAALREEEGRGALIRTLAQARRLGRQVQGVQDLYAIGTEEQAFQLMLDVAREVGWERRGWKIAATNPLMQQKLRTKGPVCGATFGRFHQSAPAVLRRDELLDPIIECEFLFTLGQPLPPRPTAYGEDEVEAAVTMVNIGIEVAECRYPRHALPPAWYVYADGFASGRYIHGSALPQWRSRLDAGIGVTLLRNGQALGRGNSNDIMGHPLRSVVWLANRLREAGIALRAGDVVSSGSCNILASARAGDKFEADFHGVGMVTLDVV